MANPYLLGAIKDLGQSFAQGRQMGLAEDQSERQQEASIDSQVAPIFGQLMGQWDNAGAAQAARQNLMSSLDAEQQRQAAAIAAQERQAALARQAAVARALAEDERDRQDRELKWKMAQEHANAQRYAARMAAAPRLKALDSHSKQTADLASALTKSQQERSKISVAIETLAQKFPDGMSGLQGNPTPEYKRLTKRLADLDAHDELLKTLFGAGSTPQAKTPPGAPRITGGNVLQQFDTPDEG
jgi:hypothetical protein